MNIQIKVLSTVAALGADCVVVGGGAYVTGLAPMALRGIRPTTILAPVTEVMQVTTGTPVVTASVDYELEIVYTNKKTGIVESKSYLLSNSGSGATATTICDFFRNAINEDSATVPIVATGTTTLILTAVAGSNSGQAQFTVRSIGTGGFGTTLDTPTTPGVIGVGKGIFLKNGEYTDPLLVDDSYYYQAIITYGNEESTGSSMKESVLLDRNVLYVLSTATNVETLVGTYGTLTQLLAGYTATYSAGVGTLAATAATDVLTLAGGGEFAAQGIQTGDVVFQVGEVVYYLINNVTSVTTANAIVGADNAAAAYTIIKIRKY